VGWKLRTYTPEMLQELANVSTSVADMQHKIGLTSGSAHISLKRLLKKHNINTTHFTGRGWARGFTKETHPSLAAGSLKTSEVLRNRPRRSLTVSHRQKLSLIASGRSFENNSRVKRYDVTNKMTGEIVSVQGTWERKFAEWLNERNVRWERPKTTFKWTRGGEDIVHTYHPDFYLPDTDEYIEIKGYMWKDEIRHIDDETKLRLVIEQNPQMRLSVFMKDCLKQLGVL
jgi:hypothetical protein